MKLGLDITYLCVIWNTLRGGCAILTSVSRELAFLYQRHHKECGNTGLAVLVSIYVGVGIFSNQFLRGHM